jgi:hypothetical protein
LGKIWKFFLTLQVFKVNLSHLRKFLNVMLFVLIQEKIMKSKAIETAAISKLPMEY